MGLIHRMPQTAFVFLVGCSGHLGSATAQRFRVRMADVPGDPAKPAAAAMGTEIHRAVPSAPAGALGGTFGRLLREGVRDHLSRPPAIAAAAEHAEETDRCSLTAMFVLPGLCLAAGILPGYVHRCLAPGAQKLVGAHMPPQAASPWLSIVPVAESRSSYNGSAGLCCSCRSARLRAALSSIASRPVRCGAARPGIADFRMRVRPPNTPASASRSPSAACLAPLCFMAREKVDMPPPGDPPPGTAHVVACATSSGTRSMRPLADGVASAAEQLQPLCSS